VTNLHPVSHLTKLLQIIGDICAFDRDSTVPVFNTLVRG